MDDCYSLVAIFMRPGKRKLLIVRTFLTDIPSPQKSKFRQTPKPLRVVKGLKAEIKKWIENAAENFANDRVGMRYAKNEIELNT